MKMKILPLLLTIFTLFGFSPKTFAQITSTLAGGGWSDTLTWIGHKMPTQNDDVIIQGPVHPGGGWAYTGNWPKCKNLRIETTGMLTASNLYFEIFDSLHNKGLIFQSALNAGSVTVHGSFFNEGEVSGIVDGYGGLTFELGKNFTNNGKFKVEMLSLADSVQHFITATDTIETTEMTGTDSTSTLLFTSNIVFKNSWIKLGKASVVLSDNFIWETWNTIVENGKIFANGSTLSLNNGRYLDIHDAKIKYFYTQWGDVEFYGTTTVTGELYGGPNSDWRVLYMFYGDLINHGIISSDYLTLELKSNFHNENETKAELVFSGTENQTFSFADTAKFTNYKTIKLTAEKTGATYQWYRNNSVINNAINSYYTFSQENIVKNLAKQGTYSCFVDGILSARKIFIGDTTTTDIEDDVTELKSFSLLQNYPNPFNPSTVISYQLPVYSFVTLKVYDVLGNEVATLVNENQSAGTHEVEFQSVRLRRSSQQLASGVYYYQLRVGDFVATKKLIVLK